MKSILLITTSSLAANPRLVKEFESLKKKYCCHVLCFKHYDWSLELSTAIKSSNPEVVFIEIDRKKEAVQTILSKLAHKLAIFYNSKLINNYKNCSFASNDKALQLSVKANALCKKHKYTRVIAHNLGAFYSAVKLSNRNDIALQLDIEDYYPGESFYFNHDLEKQNRLKLMSHSFMKANTITYASIGIQKECEKHFEVRRGTEQVVIINSFRVEDFVRPAEKMSNRIQCVWFSQKIGPNRGLEELFDAAKKLNGMDFNIIGHLDQDFLNDLDLSSNVLLYDIMGQSELHNFLATMDVGLALEPGKDLNNNIALSNKIITYAQAGLYIIATDTFGQSQFLRALNYQAGKIIEHSLEEALQNLDFNHFASGVKVVRWQNAKSFSWEREQLKLMNVIS